MRRKFKTTLIRFTSTPIFMGDFVSPADRSTVPKMMLAVLGSIGRYKIRKYCDAISLIFTSTCIHTGTIPLKDTVTAVKKMPKISVIKTACETARFAAVSSPAPNAFAM